VSKEYQKLQQDYAALVAKSKGGDLAARADKARVMGEIRQMEREGARKGELLNAVARAGGRIDVEVIETFSKRSQQEEYVRRFDNKVPVEIENRRTGEKYTGTLQKWHSKRLLGK
jgi:hypothetical protein